MFYNLTSRQMEFFYFIEEYITDNGYAPSIREIQKAFNLKSTKGVKDHIDRLVNKGLLVRKDGTARALTLPNKRATKGRRLSDKTYFAPVIGKVAAGFPILATQNRNGQLPVPTKFSNTKGLFWLEVQGDSMIDEGIFEGDFVLVQPAPFLEQGALAVIRIDNEATVKRYYHYGDTIKLVPANPNYKTMEFFRSAASEIAIEGKVISVFRFTS